MEHRISLLISDNGGGWGKGKSWIYPGGPDGIAAEPSSVLELGPWMLGGGRPAGDFDGDGYGDLAVGSGVDIGWLACFWGGPDGLASDRYQYRQSGLRDGFGAAISACDVNGDQLTDLGVVHGTSMILEVFLGNVDRSLFFAPEQAGSENADIICSDLDGDGHGDFHSVTSQGRALALASDDVTGDGYPDLILAEATVDQTRALVRVYPGQSEGPSAIPSSETTSFLRATLFDRPEGVISVHALGDVDGNGYADVALSMGTYVGAYANAQNPSRIHIYLATEAGLPTEPSWTLEEELDTTVRSILGTMNVWLHRIWWS
jgi:hypothetical protein